MYLNLREQEWHFFSPLDQALGDITDHDMPLLSTWLHLIRNGDILPVEVIPDDVRTYDTSDDCSLIPSIYVTKYRMNTNAHVQLLELDFLPHLPNDIDHSQPHFDCVDSLLNGLHNGSIYIGNTFLLAEFVNPMTT